MGAPGQVPAREGSTIAICAPARAAIQRVATPALAADRLIELTTLKQEA